MSGCYIRQEPYIDDHGIYMPVNEYVPDGAVSMFKCVMTKEMFVDAYNKWIRKYNTDTLDDCEFMNDWE